MENFKVKVNTAEESKEAQELFFELDYVWQSGDQKYLNMGKGVFYILARKTQDMSYCDISEVEFNSKNQGYSFFKTITIPQLREMVCLKKYGMKEAEYLMIGKNGERLMESVGQLKASKEKHSHYRKSVKHLDFIDPYRIAQLYNLHPCADHIAKKALCTGKRGHKDLMRDIQDIIDTAERWKQMIQEDQNAI